MPVPDFQSFFKPILDIASDGKEHSLREARQKVASLMQLSENELSEPLPSGIQTKFENRISWAISYFVQVKTLLKPMGWYFLTQLRELILITLLKTEGGLRKMWFNEAALACDRGSGIRNS
jgi:restriction endonuclease Mrr